MDVDEIERVYSAYSGFYDLIFGKLFDRARIHALARLDIKPGDRILEVGVGTGLSLPLYPRHCQIVGIDLTGPMLDKGRERVRKHGLGHVELQRMDASRMQFPDASFDAVFAAYVITAVPQPKQVLAEMARVCRPGGRIVLLNHFSNGNPLISKVERTIAPLCSRIGFRSDLSMEELFEGTDLVVTRKEKVPPLNYWRIVECVARRGGIDHARASNGASPTGRSADRPH